MLIGEELIVFNLFFLGTIPHSYILQNSTEFKWTAYANVYVTTLEHMELLHRPYL